MSPCFRADARLHSGGCHLALGQISLARRLPETARRTSTPAPVRCCAGPLLRRKGGQLRSGADRGQGEAERLSARSHMQQAASHRGRSPGRQRRRRRGSRRQRGRNPAVPTVKPLERAPAGLHHVDAARTAFKRLFERGAMAADSPAAPRRNDAMPAWLKVEPFFLTISYSGDKEGIFGDKGAAACATFKEK